AAGSLVQRKHFPYWLDIDRKEGRKKVLVTAAGVNKNLEGKKRWLLNIHHVRASSSLCGFLGFFD
ncbi:hypothetical protein, partial [Desulfovirgula thermocuniculi]